MLMTLVEDALMCIFLTQSNKGIKIFRNQGYYTSGHFIIENLSNESSASVYHMTLHLDNNTRIIYGATFYGRQTTQRYEKLMKTVISYSELRDHKVC